MNEKRQHVWQRWKKEYVHGLMESHEIAITQKLERSYLSSAMRRTEENGRKGVFCDTLEVKTESYESTRSWFAAQGISNPASSWYALLKFEAG